MFNIWKYLLASILLANIIACSNDDIPHVNVRQEMGGTRTAELVTQKVELQEAGSLQEKLTVLMGDSAVSTLQKLVVSGPFTSSDMTFVRDSLTNLAVLDMNNVQIKASEILYHNSSSEVSFRDNEICEGMFRGLRLEDVVLPSAISSIGNEAFRDCDSLRSVLIPDQVKSIGGSAFYSCDSLYSVKLPSSLESLGSSAFYNCTSIPSVEVPDGIKVINYNTFSGCRSLDYVKLPSSLEKIASWAFGYCDFSTIELPSNLKEIGTYSFYGCRNLKKMIIPESVEIVHNDFVSNSGLLSLIWNPIIDVPSCWGMSGCFLFVNTDLIGVDDINNWKAIVINGISESSINVDYGDDFVNLIEFTAKKLVYSRHFGDETTPGGSSGWKTIVLPFSPDSIYHETKGQIAPFNSGIEGAKPFWLRELTSEGFVDVTKIEANKPYLIAMPNHYTYLDEYCLSGNITFVGKDAVLTVTPDVMEASVGPEFELHPTYKRLNPSDEFVFYSLGGVWNYYEEEDLHYYKNFFMKNWSSVMKFNAYVTPLGGGRSSRALFDVDTRSKETRASYIPNKTGIPQIGDM